MRGFLALVGIARRRLLDLAVWMLLGAAVAGAANLLLPVVYEAHADVLVAAPYWNDSTALADPNFGGKSLAYGDKFTQQRMISYARLATTPLVTTAVARQAGSGLAAEDVSDAITVHALPDTVFIRVQARDASPTRAALIADATANELIRAIKDVERPPYTLVSPVQPVLTEPAAVPLSPASPRTLLNIGCGAVLGLLLGLTFVGLREHRLIEQIRGGTDDLTTQTGVVGALRTDDGDDAAVDARYLRLEVADLMKRCDARSLLLAAPRFTTATFEAATLLSAALTEAGTPAVVVVADFHAAVGASEAPGLADFLLGRADFDSLVVHDDERRVDWIPAGVQPPNATAAINSARMGQAIAALLESYRYVIVVGPAVLESTDAMDLAGHTGAAMLVCPIGATSGDEHVESERLLTLSARGYLGRVAVLDGAFT